MSISIKIYSVKFRSFYVETLIYRIQTKYILNGIPMLMFKIQNFLMIGDLDRQNVQIPIFGDRQNTDCWLY